MMMMIENVTCSYVFSYFFLLLFLHLPLLIQWHALSKDEQHKYYEMARKERADHQLKYPNWTARDNYAINQKKKKKKRDKSADGGELSINFVATCGLTHSLSLFLSVCFSFFSFSFSLLEPGSLKKCRARFGLQQQASWCKPCRWVIVRQWTELDDDLSNGPNVPFPPLGGRKSASDTQKTATSLAPSVIIWVPLALLKPKHRTLKVPMRVTSTTSTCLQLNSVYPVHQFLIVTTT